MADIYERADGVITCIGPDVPNLESAMSLIEVLWKYHETHKERDVRLYDTSRLIELGFP